MCLISINRYLTVILRNINLPCYLHRNSGCFHYQLTVCNVSLSRRRDVIKCILSAKKRVMSDFHDIIVKQMPVTQILFMQLLSKFESKLAFIFIIFLTVLSLNILFYPLDYVAVETHVTVFNSCFYVLIPVFPYNNLRAI